MRAGLVTVGLCLVQCGKVADSGGGPTPLEDDANAPASASDGGTPGADVADLRRERHLRRRDADSVVCRRPPSV